MSCPGNGIYVVQGEMATLVTAMRRGARWSSHSHQDEDQDVLIRSFSDVKDILNQIGDLRELDPNHYLGPFLEVIRSEETTGPVTSLALSAVNKFLSYRLIDPNGKSVPATVENIADAVTHARFVGTDQASDGVVLMKILQVLRTLMLSPEGVMLTNESVCEIMLSVFRICFESRLSELLRRSAEHSLKDMVQLLFSRLPQFSEDLRIPVNIKKLKMRTSAMDPSRGKRKNRTSQRSKHGRPAGLKEGEATTPTGTVSGEEATTPVEKLSLASTLNSAGHLSTTPMAAGGAIVDMQGAISQATPGQQAPSTESPVQESCDGGITISVQEASPEPMKMTLSDESLEEKGEAGEEQTVVVCNADEEGPEYVNPRGVRFMSPENGDGRQPLMPYGVVCVRELFRFLVSLCSPLDKQNTETMIHMGLTLLTVALEVGADSIAKYPSFLALVKDDLCRNLFSLLNLERLSIFAANLQVSFLLFESMRTHLKFQLEFYLTRLIDIIISDSPKVTYEQREIALDAVVQLWRIPGLVTELYLNYDCDLYCPNLFEDLTKLLSKNAFPVSGIHSTHLLSLDALLTIIDAIEAHCHRRILSERHDDEAPAPPARHSALAARQRVSERIPTHEQLMAIKCKKKLLTVGTEHFNAKPKKGIEFLQEHGLLSTPLDPSEVAALLRENPRLDKKQIGEYISGRANLNVLDRYVRSFDFTDTRIDEALRSYLEAFRLPGESPLIALIMEHFAEHWHKCNNEPFASADAAFTLAYAVIMLNVDQHNRTVKRQNNPMTSEEFKRNLKRVNGGEDFDQDMLEEVYQAVRTEEIVMPAEQTGLVRENYLWKVLLRRGNSKDGIYVNAPNGLFDHDLFSLIWGPAVAALGFVFDKTNEVNIYHKAMAGFRKCAMISAHYNMSAQLDQLVASLCKFSGLGGGWAEHPDALVVALGGNAKWRLATTALFGVAHRHGDVIRDGWKGLVEVLLQLYRCRLLPAQLLEAEDFVDPDGKISLVREETPLQKTETGLLSSLYSYIALSSESVSARTPTPEDQEATRRARHCVLECHLEQLITESKFLRLDSLHELVKALVAAAQVPTAPAGSAGFCYDEGAAVFSMELLLKVSVQNRDRATAVWPAVRDHMHALVMGAAACDQHYLLERAVVGLLRLAVRLMRREDMSPLVLQALRMLLLLKSPALFRVSRQVAYGLHELLKTSAANIHSDADWAIIFTLLECVGGGAPTPRVVGAVGGETSADSEGAPADSGVGSDSELSRNHSSRPTSPEASPSNAGGWILVGPEGEIQPVGGRGSSERELLPHDPHALVKCCEAVAFLVRDVAHITPYNFENCVHCIRTFVEASLHGTEKKHLKARSAAVKDKSRKKSARRKDEADRSRSPQPAGNPYDADESDAEEVPSSYPQVSLQLLDLMHTLHTRTAHIFRWWAEEGGADLAALWAQGWRPLLQGIARLCTDNRRQVRTSAITYLQRALLVHDLQTLTASEWESCFDAVLFPLLRALLDPGAAGGDPAGAEEARMRAAAVLAKVFLHHLAPLRSLPSFPALWVNVIHHMDRYMHASNSDLLYEAIPESLKNMLLVMDSAGVFTDADGYTPLWELTWERIDPFLPNLRDDLFKARRGAVESPTRVVGQEPPEDSLGPVDHELPSAVQAQEHVLSPTTQEHVQSPMNQEHVQSPTTQELAQSPMTQAPSFIQQPNNPIFTHIGHMGHQMISTAIGPTSSHVPLYEQSQPPQHPAFQPVPLYEHPVPHPVTLYEQPVPQSVPLYEQPVPQPVPLYEQPVPQPVPVYEQPVPLYDQPVPQPVPLFSSFASSFETDPGPVGTSTAPAGGSNIPAHYFYSAAPVAAPYGTITAGNVIQTSEERNAED